jgi:hypothetical protein
MNSAPMVPSRRRACWNRSRVGVFDQARLDAARRWRYPPGAARTVKERIAFQPPAAARAGASPAPAAGPRNACVKEGNVDELVDIVQVQLINACAEPVLVHHLHGRLRRACGSMGVRRAAGRARPARRRTERLLGEMTTDSGRIRFGYTEENYVSRPAASRYALIACAVGDRDCYSAACAGPTTSTPSRATSIRSRQRRCGRGRALSSDAWRRHDPARGSGTAGSGVEAQSSRRSSDSVRSATLIVASSSHAPCSSETARYDVAADFAAREHGRAGRRRSERAAERAACVA